MENIIIIGSGPAGLTAGIYCARAGLSPLVIGGPKPGGQLTETAEIENFPGFAKPISGYELMSGMRLQAENCGIRTNPGTVVAVDLHGAIKTLTLEDGSTLEAKAVIVATGASAKWTGAVGEQTYRRHGISACATCDGFFFRGKDVAVIGGGETAMADAVTLARICKSVTIIHRRDAFRAAKTMTERVLGTPNVKVLWNSTVAEFTGDGKKLTGIIVESTIDHQRTELAVNGAFIAIGHKPATDFLANQLELDNGYVVAHGCQTAVPGVFVAGDCMDSRYRQAVFAAGQGAAAALEVQRYLENN